nr:hypothetical protein [Actinomycetota bacterium]
AMRLLTAVRGDRGAEAEPSEARFTARAVAGAALEQVGVAAGQGVAGVGNLVFTLVTARVLAPRSFAQMAAFSALYLLWNLPSTSLSATAALDPTSVRRSRVRFGMLGAVFGMAMIAVSGFLAPVLGLPVGLVVALAAASPLAPVLALERGRLYGQQRHGLLVGSLVAEPVVRLTLGSVALVELGALGGAVSVILGGVAALEVATLRSRSPKRSRRPLGVRPWEWAAKARAGVGGAFLPEGSFSRSRSGRQRHPEVTSVATSAGGMWAALAFMLVGLLQYLSLLAANRLLSASGAGEFAAVSTVGGIAAFATATVPLVLLPAASRGQRHALSAAVSVTAIAGLVATAVAYAAPGLLITELMGARYGSAAPLVGPYVVAMSLFGLVRVLVSHDCATGRSRSVTLLLIVAAAVQTAVLLAEHTAGGMAMATLVTMAALTIGQGLVAVGRAFRGRRAQHRL